MKLVLAKNVRLDFECVREADYFDRCDDEYVQISEVVEVEFPPLQESEIVTEQLRVLDTLKKDVQAEAQKRINDIEQRKAELLAIEYQS